MKAKRASLGFLSNSGQVLSKKGCYHLPREFLAWDRIPFKLTVFPWSRIHPATNPVRGNHRRGRCVGRIDNRLFIRRRSHGLCGLDDRAHKFGRNHRLVPFGCWSDGSEKAAGVALSPLTVHHPE